MKLKLIDIKTELPDVESFILEPDQPLTWQPGQYLHYVFPHQSEDDRGHERWFTISSAPFEKHVMITTRFSSQEGSSFKHALQALQPGDTLEADGPKGSFTVDDSGKKHIFIAGGIGITPYRSILLQLDHDNQPLNVELLYANRDDQLVFGGELETLAQKHPEFKTKPYIGDQRISADELKAYMAPDVIYYISGPKPMVEAYQHTLADLQVPETQVKTDYFPGYQIG
jgi:ferredoxin-NADP reductase